MKPSKILSTNVLEHLHFSLMLLAIIVITSSCGDDHILKPIIDDQQITTRETVDDPILQNGYLLFEDRDHLQKYYTYLEAVADTATELNDALLAVAIRLGHNSLLYSDTSAFSTPLFVASNFGRVSDPVKRVILNSKQEVGIGDSLFVF